MSERGEYRAIRRVLLDGPDFQKLPERARWVFVALKLNMGPAGIEVHYPDALVAILAAQTGATADQVREALEVLEQQGWIDREANVIVVNGHLENDPHVKASDVKHRTGVQRHIAGLPRLAIVRRFIGSHREWIPPSEGATQGLGWAFEGPSMALGSREPEPEPEPEVVSREGPSDGSAASHAGSEVSNDEAPHEKPADAAKPHAESLTTAPAAGWIGQLREHWRSEVGEIERDALFGSLKDHVHRDGADTVRTAISYYAEERKRQNKPAKFAWFLEEIGQWLARARDPIVIDGVLTPIGERMTRPVGAAGGAR